MLTGFTCHGQKLADTLVIIVHLRSASAKPTRRVNPHQGTAVGQWK